MTHIHPRLGRSVGLLCALAVPLAACGDDETTSDTAAATENEATTPAETSAADGTSTPEANDTPTTHAEGTDVGVCAPYIDVSLAFNGEPDPSTLTPMLDDIEATAPEAIDAELQTMIDAARTVIESGGQDFSPFETQEFADATSVVDPWMYEHCEFDNRFEVAAEEYRFVDLEPEVSAGQTAVLLTNEGNEVHEMAIMRKADGVTESWDEILALDEEQAMELVEEVGGAFTGTKGEQSLAILELTPGEYVAICFIPTGTVVTGGEFVEGTGQPHFMQGMQTEFTVT